MFDLCDQVDQCLNTTRSLYILHIDTIRQLLYRQVKGLHPLETFAAFTFDFFFLFFFFLSISPSEAVERSDIFDISHTFPRGSMSNI